MSLQTVVTEIESTIADIRIYRAAAEEVLEGTRKLQRENTTPQETSPALGQESNTYSDCINRADNALNAIAAVRGALQALLDIGFPVIPVSDATLSAINDLKADVLRMNKAIAQLRVVGATQVSGIVGPERPTQV